MLHTQGADERVSEDSRLQRGGGHMVDPVEEDPWLGGVGCGPRRAPGALGDPHRPSGGQFRRVTIAFYRHTIQIIRS